MHMFVPKAQVPLNEIGDAVSLVNHRHTIQKFGRDNVKEGEVLDEVKERIVGHSRQPLLNT